MKKGYFITFEGIDGSGKTTQLMNVKSYLENKGYNVITTKEPGALDVGKQIREILLNGKNNISSGCEMFLFLADRANHVEMFIKPHLEEGTVVLCDRYVESTVAYQGFGRGQDIELLQELNRIATKRIYPDLTLLFDVTAQTGLKRVGAEKDRMEKSGTDFYDKVRNGYLELQKRNTKRIKLINAEKTAEEVFEEVKSEINKLIQEK